MTAAGRKRSSVVHVGSGSAGGSATRCVRHLAAVTVRGRFAISVALALALSGCAVSGLSFKQDHRVSIVTPKANASVALPLRVEWDARDFDGSFAVFFDRSPMKPGQSLRSLVPENDACRVRDVCPDAEWLADRHIYVTDSTELRVLRLPDRRDKSRSTDRHEIAIVLLDASGRRVGESVFTKEFIVDRQD